MDVREVMAVERGTGCAVGSVVSDELRAGGVTACWRSTTVTARLWMVDSAGSWSFSTSDMTRFSGGQ